MTAPDEIVVVGASAAGLATAEYLRHGGHRGGLTVLGAERHLPYDRPPLSKQVLSGSWEPERTALRAPAALSAVDIDVLVDDPAVGLGTGTVHTESGRVLRADAVVVATGARPRVLPGQGDLAGVHVLRTLDDSLALQKDLRSAARLVVIGEGVLGCEIAATARGMGRHVTIAGPQPVPMAAQVGPLVGGLLADLHAEHGVELRLSTGADSLTAEHGRVTGVRLTTGEVVPADVVVVAIGVVPATGWLDGSGLTVDDGVVCDSRCRAADGVYAVGDVARWRHERLGRLVRLENRTNATEQAAVVAANILGADRPYTPVPYFWTDQFDARIQVHGFLPADAEVSVVDGSLAERRFVAQYRQAGRVTGVLGWNMPKQSRIRRQEIDGLA